MEQKELRELEDMCIQECAPTCTAACPIHVDVRAMISEIRRGDFAAALKFLKKTLPFPGIIGRICDQPCRVVCKRNEVGESIAIAALERACADLAATSAEKPMILPRRGKRVAIVGGGLSGLTVAFDLGRKGYGVTIFEAEGHLGGGLWEISDDKLPRPVILKDIAVVEYIGVEVRLNTPVGQAISLARVRDEFDAVYLGIGANPGDTFGLRLDGHGQIEVDPVTLTTSQDGVFAGGSLLRSKGKRSPIQSIGDGRRAATSIDRYLQKVSLTAARTNEGPYTTRLYTKTQGIEPLLVVPMSDPMEGYSQDEAVQEAKRCLQCECMECVKVCEYLARFGSYPKKYVRQIYNNLSIVKGNRQYNKFINSCSLCGLCYEVCPEDLHMGTVCKNARQTMVKQGRMPPSAHDFALRDMQFSNSETFALARNKPGTTTSDFVFFPGCQLSASAPEYVEKVYAYLMNRLPARVGLMLRCCGVPAEWAGRTDVFQAALTDFRDRHLEMGNPRLVLACSSCYQVFKTHLPDVEVVSLWQLFDTLGLPSHPTNSPDFQSLKDTRSLAVHDPCTTRYDRAIHDSVRNILHRLGCQIDELPLAREKTECCSYGGLMWLANPELASAIVRRRIQEHPADYVTYCAMCRDFFASRGKRTLHLLDLIYRPPSEADARAIRGGPGYSQRHENRARLKRKLLKEVWGEEMAEQKRYEAIKLIIPDEVQERLEERLILVEDIQQVIDFAESTGSKLLNRRTHHFLAYNRPASVTYWVEYSPHADAFVVHNAYSHRMEIVADVKT